ncbi:MAG TPA: hypothetical protein VEL73_00975 [Mycobacteriales bacterium]|nr:hypothetical protein [Mycobacteriales bacterium]
MIRAVRRVAAVAVVGAVLVGGVAGCGGDGPAPAPAPRSAARKIDPARGLTQEQAERALLVASDLPLGFQAQDGSPDASALGCAGIDRVYLADGAAARAETSFGHAVSPAFVNETITTRPGGAEPALAGFRRAAQDCASFTGRDGTVYRIAALAMPSYGNGSAAVRVTSGLSEARPVDLVAVRLGDTILVVASAGAGTDDDELARTVLARAVVKIARTRAR